MQLWADTRVHDVIRGKASLSRTHTAFFSRHGQTTTDVCVTRGSTLRALRWDIMVMFCLLELYIASLFVQRYGAVSGGRSGSGGGGVEGGRATAPPPPPPKKVMILLFNTLLFFTVKLPKSNNHV